jgi:hypothetical protein
VQGLMREAHDGTMHNARCTMHDAQCTARCRLCTVPCALCIARCALYTARCALCTVHRVAIWGRWVANRTCCQGGRPGRNPGVEMEMEMEMEMEVKVKVERQWKWKWKWQNPLGNGPAPGATRLTTCPGSPRRSGCQSGIPRRLREFTNSAFPREFRESEFGHIPKGFGSRRPAQESRQSPSIVAHPSLHECADDW